MQIPSDLIQIERKHFTSRSAVLCYNTCHYKRYLQYELEGTGYTTEKISLDLLIGICVHRGLQHLLEHCRLEHPNGDFEEACIDQAVAFAYEVWRETLSSHMLWLHNGEEDRLDWIIAEQECLFEGLIRAFAARRLPALLEEYTVLEVEHEEVFEDFSQMVTFLGKADGLFLRKADYKLVILSIKTASQFAEVTTRDILHDMQGISEWAIVQDRLNKIWFQINGPNYIAYETSIAKTFKQSIIGKWEISEQLFDFLSKLGEAPEVFAIQYEYLLKGQRKQDPYGSGIYKQNSFLCHPYQQNTIQQLYTGINAGITINPAEYKWKIGKGKQPKGWEKADIWNDIGIKGWIEMLATGQVQPEEGHPFDNILITPDLVVRTREDIKEWLISTRFQEENIVKGLSIIRQLQEQWNSSMLSNNLISNEDIEAVNRNYSSLIQEAIWCFFPKNTLSCHDFYGKDCPYVIHCHELESLGTLTSSGYLIRRESHHELERETLIELIEGNK